MKTNLFAYLFLNAISLTRYGSLGQEKINEEIRLTKNLRIAENAREHNSAQRMLEAQLLTGFSLIDADTDQEITRVTNGDEFCFDDLQPSTNFNLRANPVIDADIDSVSFAWKTKKNDESVAPYSAGGDIDGDFNALRWLSNSGVKEFHVTAIAGDITQSIVIQFTMKDTGCLSYKAPTQAPAPTPTSIKKDVSVVGELRKWHKITLVFWNGPETSETALPNPFTDYRLDVTFKNEQYEMVVPGYYAADGDAANTSADSGSVWHCHFSPPAAGTWTWSSRFLSGANVAMQWPDNVSGNPGALDGLSGTFEVAPSNKSGRDLRGKGLLQYVGKHHLQFAETGEFFLKAGADSPENFLDYEDFDNTFNLSPDHLYLKSWAPHQQDYREGIDPSWADGKGTEIIGAINYLSNQGMNVFSFLTFSVEGDDGNVFPHISATDRLRIDVSKTAQWEIIFEHGTRMGMYLHFKTQEIENNFLMDDGRLGKERRLYYRELIARFGHHLALNWNLGEENTNTDGQRKKFSDFFKAVDPYRHPVVVHTLIGDQNKVYGALYGYPNFDGASIQTHYFNVFRDTLARVQESAVAGRPWIVANDEQGNQRNGVKPDRVDHEHDGIRQDALWGNIMAGGAGCEFYFGYRFEHSDMTCQDYRSRSNMWKQARIALDFFSKFQVPFQDMTNANDLLVADDSNWCLKERNTGSVIVVYLRFGGTTSIDLSGIGFSNMQSFTVKWYDPKNGGGLQQGSVESITAAVNQTLGYAPNNNGLDWVVLIRA